MDSNFYKFLKLLKESYLQESVTFFIADVDKEVENLLELSQKLLWGDYITDFANKFFSEEEKNWFSENRKPLEWITADGGHEFAKNGILNVYLTPIPERWQEKFLSAIKYYIVEFGGKVTGSVIKNKSSMYDSDVYRIPVEIVVNSKNNPPELNISTANARAIFVDVLNYSDEYFSEYPNVPANELLMKIEQVEDNEYQIQSAARETEIEGNFISVGLDEEKIKRILNSLKDICNWAIDNNYTYISLA